MRLVEVVKTVTTDPAIVQLGLDFARRVGKTPILTTDRAGFIVNRLLVPYLRDAVRICDVSLRNRSERETLGSVTCNCFVRGALQFRQSGATHGL
jgi:3-hydroxybutyryl-CoA dehydrogenase